MDSLDYLLSRETLEEFILLNHPDYRQPTFKESLFHEQRAYIEDKSSYKVAICSRRAGKSISCAGALLEAARDNPGSYAPYIGLTRAASQKIIWPAINWEVERFFPEATVRDSDLTVSFPNGSEVFVYSAEQKNLAGRLRGLAFSRIAIDEAQNFKSDVLEKLIDDVIDPALADFDGQLMLQGTPGPVPAGYFYDICKDPKTWSIHHWTAFQNPYIDAEKRIQKVLERKGWTIDHPTIRREWFGEWVVDDDALVYKFKKDRNLFSKLPEGVEWFYTIGVDLGWHDHSAFVVLAHSHKHPQTYIVHAKQYQHLIPSDICGYVKKLWRRFNRANVVVDTGGLGKSIAEEMRIRWGIPAEAAEKREKYTNIELMNGDFTSGKILVWDKLHELAHQYSILVKNEDGEEDEALPNHLCDAALYAYRKSVHYVYRKEKHEPAPDTDEFMDLQAEKEAQEMERVEKGDYDFFEKEYGELD